MDRKSFKIGDKVKLRSNYIRLFPQGTKIGEVIGFDEDYILVNYKNCIYREGFPYVVHEIEHAVKIGEQLMFAFMRTSD